MKKTSWIIGIFIFLAVTGVIAYNIFQVVARQIITKNVEWQIRGVLDRTEGSLPKAEFEKRVAEEIDKVVEFRTGHILNRIIRLSPDRMTDVRKVTWAGHRFETADLRSIQYRSGGPIEWTANGFIAGSSTMPRTKLLDVDFNQKVKVTVFANMEGELTSDNRHCTSPSCVIDSEYNFVELPIYFVDNDETKYGMRLFGTRTGGIIFGNARNKFKYTWFSVENTGKNIILEDSGGGHSVIDDSVVSAFKLSDLNPKDPWQLRINADVNGEGYAKLEIKEIRVEKR